MNMYQTMLRIRAFETKAAECFTKGMLAGTFTCASVRKQFLQVHAWHWNLMII